MEFHDYTLKGYSVSDRGSTLTLDLLYDYPGQPLRESTLQFEGVALYHLIHTSTAIITSIEEVPTAKFLEEISGDLHKWQKTHGLTGWRDNVQNYIAHAVESGLKAWTIDSAIGFSGFVVGRSLK